MCFFVSFVSLWFAFSHSALRTPPISLTRNFSTPNTMSKASETEQIDIVKRYLAALEAGATGDALAAYFTPDAIQEEFPNRLNPNGGRSDVATILARAEQGRHVLTAQRFDLVNAMACGDTVALELNWSGRLAVPIGTLQPGDTMHARFAIFIELRDGRIFRQRNYDCFEPWPGEG